MSGAEETSPIRFVEYYSTVVELDAGIVLRRAAGWELLSAGFVDASKLWAEYEREVPRGPGDPGLSEASGEAR